MSRMRNAQENVQAHRVVVREEILAIGRRAGGEIGQDDIFRIVIHDSPWVKRYLQIYIRVTRNG
jgi:hypothetical protein